MGYMFKHAVVSEVILVFLMLRSHWNSQRSPLDDMTASSVERKSGQKQSLALDMPVKCLCTESI